LKKLELFGILYSICYTQTYFLPSYKMTSKQEDMQDSPFITQWKKEGETRRHTQLNRVKEMGYETTENKTCDFCYFEDPYSKDKPLKKIGCMKWNGKSICSECVDKILLAYYEDIFIPYRTSCGICKKSFPEERRKFEQENSDMFGICGGPTFVCANCINDGFSILSGHGGGDQIRHSKRKVGDKERDPEPRIMYKDELERIEHYSGLSEEDQNYVKKHCSNLQADDSDQDQEFPKTVVIHSMNPANRSFSDILDNPPKKEEENLPSKTNLNCQDCSKILNRKEEYTHETQPLASREPRCENCFWKHLGPIDNGTKQ
jgi:hypothetical protein